MRTTTMFGALITMAATAAIFVSPGCTVSLEDATASYVSALCQYGFNCFPWSTEAVFGDQATCEAAYLPLEQKRFALPGAAPSGDQVQACADALKATACDEYDAARTCQFVGTLAENAPCVDGVQCASTYCSFASSTMSSKCGVCRARGALGGVCADLAACDAGSICSGGKCVALPSKGDACPSGVCGASLLCHGGVCVAGPKVGDACASFADCNVALGLSCDTTTMKCVELKLAALGETCGDSYTVCAGAGICDHDTKKCVPPAQIGEPCSSSNNTCAPMLVCTDDKCAELVFPTCE